MDKNKLQTLRDLWENAENGDVAEMKALTDFCKAEGISIEEAEGYLSANYAPETAVEKRRERKDKAANDWSTQGAISKEAIDEAYNVDNANREFKVGALDKYVKDNGIFSRIKGETQEEYVDRNKNAFEKLGLNWNNKEDRALLANSLGLLIQQDYREGLKEEKNSGLYGFLHQFAGPRVSEHEDRDIMAGEETDGYLKDYLLDMGENALMLLPNPVTGALKAISGIKAVDKAYKNFKKGKKLLDGRTKANKALKGVGSLAGYVADNATVPFTVEALDAAAYDEENNPRSDFSVEDAEVGTVVNGVAPIIFGRTGGRLAAYLPQSIRQRGGEFLKVFEPVSKAIDPYVTNKFGRSDMAKRIPGLATIEEVREKEVAEMKEKADNLASRKLEWEKGLHIPTNEKDKYWNEFVEWSKAHKKKTNSLQKYL